MALPASQPIDGNGRTIEFDGWDATNNQYVVSENAAGTQATGQPFAYAARKVALSSVNTGLPVNAPVIVQKAGGASTGSVATLAQAFTSANVTGNSIIVVCAVGNGTAPTVADSNGNTYTQSARAANSTTFEVAIFHAVNVAGGAVNTVTVTNAGTAASMSVEIYEVSGLIAQVAAQPDSSSTGTGTGTTASTSGLAASSPNSLAFLGVAVGTTAEAVTAVTGTPWTADASYNTTTPSGLFSLGSLSLYLDDTNAVIPQATIAASKPWAAAAAIFKPVVLGVQGTVTIAGYNYARMTAAATLLVKTGAGILHAIIINTPVASGTIEFDDALTNTTPIIGKITLPGTLLSDGPKMATYDVAFSTGLSITTTGTMDITIVWK
jgi:hypothetical protein